MKSCFASAHFVTAFLFALTLSANAQHVVKTVQVGSEPRGVAINPLTDSVYIANTQTGNVSILKHDVVIATLPVNTLPEEVTFDIAANKAYVGGCDFRTNAGSKVIVIDGRTNQITTTIDINEFCVFGIQGITVNPLTHRVYVSNYDDNEEVVIDGTNNQIISRIDLAGREPEGAAVDLHTNQIWVTLDGPDGKIDILDGAANTVLETVTVGNFFVVDVAINNVTKRAYIASTATNGLFVYDAPTRQQIADVATGSFNNSLDVDPITNLIFVTDGNNDNVVVVDGRNNTVRATVPLSAPFPAGVAINPVRRIAYVTEFDSTQVQLVSER